MAFPAPSDSPKNEQIRRSIGSKPSCSPQGITPPKVIPSEALFEGSRLVVIDHAGDPYRLMITKNGKLILQK